MERCVKCYRAGEYRNQGCKDLKKCEVCGGKGFLGGESDNTWNIVQGLLSEQNDYDVWWKEKLQNLINKYKDKYVEGVFEGVFEGLGKSPEDILNTKYGTNIIGECIRRTLCNRLNITSDSIEVKFVKEGNYLLIKYKNYIPKDVFKCESEKLIEEVKREIPYINLFSE